MRNLQIIVVSIFLIVSIAFAAFFSYDRLMVDHTAPVITCTEQFLHASVNASHEELCAGLTAYDDVDGDLTDYIVVRKVSQLVNSNQALISYVVFDSSSNLCTFSRYVTYTDYHKPRFSLSQPLIYNVNSVVTLSDRLHAYDALDGDISSRIRVDASALSNTVEGTYPLSIRVTNNSGDTSEIKLTTLIQNVSARHPVIRLSEYLIYVPFGETLDTEDFRGYIETVRSYSVGEILDPQEVEIVSDVNTNRRGSYDVYYSYTNEDGLSYTVILTVVVE